MHDFFASWSARNPEALASITPLYAPVVEFYGKPTTRPALLAQKRAFTIRWPSRSYVARPGSLDVGCEAGSEICTVAGLVDWDCRSAERNAQSTGTAKFSLKVAFRGGGVILSESGAVVARNAAR